MERKQNVYYALGILSYAVALADGEIQEEEKQKLRSIVKEEVDHDIDFGYADIIFDLIVGDEAMGIERIYDWAIRELKKGRHYLDDATKQKMIEVLYKIAEAFDNIDSNEEVIIKRFEEDVKNIGSAHPLS